MSSTSWSARTRPLPSRYEHHRQADAQPHVRSASRRASSTTAARSSRSGSTSPGSRATSPRERSCCSTESSGSETSSGSPSTSSSATAARRSTRVGLVPVHPATQGISPPAPARAGQQGAAADARRQSSRSRHGCGSRRSCRSGRRHSRGAHFPAQRGRRARAPAGGSRSRSCSCSSSPWRGRRRARREGRRARPLAARGVVVDRWRWSLPFELTGDQLRAIGEIDADLARERPMQRLLMGEVGAGKTVVALAAMLRAVENGAQAALMAPTETLAEQHHRTLDSLLGGPLPVELLTGSTPRGAPARAARPAGQRPAPARGGHARADRGGRGVPRPRRRGRGRAAPLRRAPARGARREGARRARAARAAHDRHADPAHALADRLRRPRRHRAARAAARPPARRDARGGRRPRAGARVRAHPRGDRGGAAVLRRLPARRGVGGAPGHGGHR